MSQLLIQDYFNELDRLRKFSGSLTEGVISDAFRDLLKGWARQNHLQFVPQYEFESTQKNRIRPDGTILHELRVPLGYWEAKDTQDDLDREIAKKLAKGYPQDNIIFENSATAVLIQNRQEVMRCDMLDGQALARLVGLFFSHERPEIADFRKAVAQFKVDLPEVLKALRLKIDAAYAGNAEFQQAASAFLAQAKSTINPAVSEADIREMLIQHILTEEIFTHVFNEGDFHRENNIAKSLYELEGKFFTGATKKDTLKALETYYGTIRSTAALIKAHTEKQKFLKVIYEGFYKVYNPKAADRLGVVYTPNEIVRFMIEGADWLCQSHFGRALIDPDVEILDPATGTGTFICELMEHFRGQPKKLAHKYKEELHANEVAILPYYVANLNIEATYAAISGQYAEYPNLCFVDTLDNVAGLGIRAGHQHDLFGAISEENVERIKRQNRRKISVVIGNPPYNAWQENFNQNNANRSYRRIDERIRDTYILKGSAQNKNSVYDMYTRFFRWASDRLHDDGVLAFVTNRNFIEKAAFDGFRRDVAEEFDEIHVVDLGGDVRANPKISGTKHNVFGIQTGVTISLLVKKRKGKAQKGARASGEPCRIHYVRRPEFETAEDKLAWLGSQKLSALAMERIQPDARHNWLNQTTNDWESLIPLASKGEKAGRRGPKDNAIFRLFSSGLKSQRDEWVYDATREGLAAKARHLVGVYEATRADAGHEHRGTIKWDAELDRYVKGGIRKSFDEKAITRAAFRPFTARFLYFDRHFNGRTYQLPAMFPPGKENRVIGFSNAKRVPFQILASDHLASLDFFVPDASQLVSRHRYTPTGERLDNITDWGLAQFQKHYGKDGRAFPSPLAGEGGPARSDGPDEGYGADEATPHPPASQAPSPARGEGKTRAAAARLITKDDIFHYVYAALHDPIYRETYAQNLKRDFPRIPLHADFWRWAAWGEALMGLHIGYENVEPFPLARIETPDEKARAAGVSPRVVLRADRDNGVITLDSETALTGIPQAAWEYRLGNRSALDWILDQHKEKTPKDPTIREKFNTYRFADHKEKVIDLIMRVTRVSVETVMITEAMRSARR